MKPLALVAGMARAAMALAIMALLMGCGKQPGEQGARRLRAMKEQIARQDFFRLCVAHCADDRRPTRLLLLLDLKSSSEGEAAHDAPRVEIDATQARKIADYLAGAGLLDTALSNLHELQRPRDPPCYVLSVVGGIEGGFSMEIGRGATAVKHLEALRALLDGTAAAKMESLLGEMKEALRAAAVRKKALIESVESFGLALCYEGSADKPFYELTLSVKPFERDRATPFMLDAVIDKDTALKVIDWLADSEILARAVRDTRFNPGPPRGRGPRYMLYFGNGESSLECDLGWEMPMLRELLRLRGRLNGDAAKQMDVLMGRLSGYIKEWTGKPYEAPK